jgi:DNA replication protein DnaC
MADLTSPRAELERIFADIRAREAARLVSPYRCVDRCGEKVLDDGERCADCFHRRAAEEERRQLVLATRAGLPRMFQWASFDAPELAARVKDPAALAKARALPLSSGMRAVFQGRAAGIGKTSLACALLLALVGAIGKAGDYVTSFDLAKARAVHGLGSEPFDVERALRSPALVLDELGSEASTPHSAVVEIIQARHAAQRPTIITTPFDEVAIATKYGDGIARRVFEGAAIFPMRAGAILREVAA